MRRWGDFWSRSSPGSGLGTGRGGRWICSAANPIAPDEVIKRMPVGADPARREPRRHSIVDGLREGAPLAAEPTPTTDPAENHLAGARSPTGSSCPPGGCRPARSGVKSPGTWSPYERTGGSCSEAKAVAERHFFSASLKRSEQPPRRRVHCAAARRTQIFRLSTCSQIR